MSAPKIYVAAPWECAPMVRDVHTILYDRGFEPTSTWCEHGSGASEGPLNADVALAAMMANCAAIRASDAMVVIRRIATGGEMFVEFEKARRQGLPVFWVGKPILSTFAAGVTLCDSLPDALQALEVMKGANPWNTETI